MAAPARALNPFHTSTNHSPVTSIISLLQTLNPQTPNPSNLSSAPLNQFSPHLNPTLVLQVIQSLHTNPHHALFFFKWASNPHPNPNNYSHTFKCYSAITDLLLSHSLFSSASSLLQASDKLSDFLIGRFITVHGRRGDVRAAVDWFNKAKLIENGRCLFSYNAILGVLVRANRIGLAKSIYDQMLSEGVVKPDVWAYTIMIRGLCKVGEIGNAQKVFDKMTCVPNLVTYNTMIYGLCEKGEVNSARRVLGEMMEREDCLPDKVTYTTLIDGYSKKGELGEAMKCMDEMVRGGVEANVLTYNAVIHGFCLRGDVSEAKRMMTRMRLNGVKDDVVTHTSILKGLYVAGRANKAVEHLKEMGRLGMKLDVKAYGIVVNAYCKMKELDGAISLLMEMRMRGLKPSVSSFNAVLSVLVENGEVERAVNLVKQMPQMGCFPNFFSYNTVICSLCNVRGRMEEVEELICEMLRNGHALDSTLCSCLIQGYCKDGDFRSAMQVFCDALDRRYIISLESFSVCVKELCAKGKTVEAERMFEDMRKRCSVVHIDSYRRVLDDHLCL